MKRRSFLSALFAAPIVERLLAPRECEARDCLTADPDTITVTLYNAPMQTEEPCGWIVAPSELVVTISDRTGHVQDSWVIPAQHNEGCLYFDLSVIGEVADGQTIRLTPLP